MFILKIVVGDFWSFVTDEMSFQLVVAPMLRSDGGLERYVFSISPLDLMF